MEKERAKQVTGLALLVASLIGLFTGFNSMRNEQLKYQKIRDTKPGYTQIAKNNYYQSCQGDVRLIIGSLPVMAIGAGIISKIKPYESNP